MPKNSNEKTCHLTEDRIDRKPAPYEIMVYRISTGMAGFTAVFSKNDRRYFGQRKRSHSKIEAHGGKAAST